MRERIEIERSRALDPLKNLNGIKSLINYLIKKRNCFFVFFVLNENKEN